MRILMKVTLPHASFNAAIKDGTASAKMKRILSELKPEAVYFAEFAGKRTGILIINMEHAHQIPALAEPWFLTFDADVEFHPCMTPEDLAKPNMASLGKT